MDILWSILSVITILLPCILSLAAIRGYYVESEEREKQVAELRGEIHFLRDLLIEAQTRGNAETRGNGW